MAFAMSLSKIISFVDERDKLSMICDDEEEIAPDYFKLYRLLKIREAAVRNRIISIAFADDSMFAGIQAADVVCSLCRREAERVFHGERYDMKPLFDLLCKPVGADRLFSLDSAFAGEDNLINMGKDLDDLQGRYPDVPLGLVAYRRVGRL